MDRNEAIKAARNGAIAAVISGTLTLAIVVIAIFSNAEGTLGIWNDPSNFFDIVLIFACAFGMYRKSRAAAVIIFVYFILAKIIMGIEMGKTTGLLTSLIFLYFYGKAIQGTFIYHKIEKAENPDYKPTSKWVYYFGIPGGLLVVTLMIIGIMTMTGVVPSTEVVKGSELSSKEIELLRNEEIVSKNENIEYFYSGGFTSILEAGNILTDQRVIVYQTDEKGQLEIYELYFPDIASVALVEEGSYINPSVYQVNSHRKDAWLKLFLSIENRGDVSFVEALRNKIGSKNP